MAEFFIVLNIILVFLGLLCMGVCWVSLAFAARHGYDGWYDTLCRLLDASADAVFLGGTVLVVLLLSLCCTP